MCNIKIISHCGERRRFELLEDLDERVWWAHLKNDKQLLNKNLLSIITRTIKSIMCQKDVKSKKSDSTTHHIPNKNALIINKTL
jgi:hypothetical protein